MNKQQRQRKTRKRRMIMPDGDKRYDNIHVMNGGTKDAKKMTRTKKKIRKGGPFLLF